MRSRKKASQRKKQNQRGHDASVASSFLNVELFPHFKNHGPERCRSDEVSDDKKKLARRFTLFGHDS